jgi:peroxiredoxin
MTPYPDAALEPGVAAPDFSLPVTVERSMGPADFRGRALIIAFYPADWSPICTDQMSLYNEVLPVFQELGGELVGISIDHVWCHGAFAEHRKLTFPLLADFEPKGEIAKTYGVYEHELGMSGRALFVLDKEGKIFWSYVSPVGVNPGADGILAALESLGSENGA